ncbi:hypothetical protein [Sporichthya polymorpha]|uniref:hypothetical protein n=1 Tax=Sporichthya polymorpha TaxID=35751 RepID=UPI00035E9AFA|nr:hypothetical protein [Sporichthya polymorpha]
MAVRSTTARRLATVIVATAAVSAVGTGAASAATNPAPTTNSPSSTTQSTVPPLSLPQVGVLLHNLLGTVDGLLGDSLGIRTPEEVAANADKPLLGKTVDNLTKTTKELPLLGGAVGGLTDGLGLSEPAKTGSKPQPAPQTVLPPKKPVKKPTETDRVDSIADPGSTWTAPMEQTPVAPAPVVREPEKKPEPGGLPGLVNDIRGIFPSNAAEAAAAGAGAATIALIVLGGIAVTGAAGAASTAGRRGLINGSVGGSL